MVLKHQPYDIEVLSHSYPYMAWDSNLLLILLPPSILANEIFSSKAVEVVVLGYPFGGEPLER